MSVTLWVITYCSNGSLSHASLLDAFLQCLDEAHYLLACLGFTKDGNMTRGLNRLSGRDKLVAREIKRSFVLLIGLISLL